MNDAVLEVRNLSVLYYGDGRPIRPVDDVSFAIAAGSTLGLIGESGCGKSATALAILRLIDPNVGRIVGGEVLLQGRDILSMTRAQLRETRGGRIGFVAQDPLSSLNPLMSVGSQITEVLRTHLGLSRTAARARAVELIEAVGIPDASNRMRDYPHQFSGGMRQRVGIAMAIACDPVVLIADEPTTALDVTIQAQILELLKGLSAERGMATLLISHDLGVAANICDHINVMYAGQIVEQADVWEFFARPRMPYSSGLLSSLPYFADPEDNRLRAIPGAPPPMDDQPGGCRYFDRCAEHRPPCAREIPRLSAREPADHLARCFGTERGGWIR